MGVRRNLLNTYSHRPPWLYRKYLPKDVIWKGDKSENTVYLTFDDGPDPEITAWVVEELSTRDMRATFFLVGDNVDRFPGGVDLIVNSGSEVGYHTFHHLSAFKVSKEDYLHDLRLNINQYKSELFRPPYGRITRGICEKVDQKIVMWSLLSGDFDKNREGESILRMLKKETRSGDIIVFHDSKKAESNLRSVLPRYLDWLQSENINTALVSHLDL